MKNETPSTSQPAQVSPDHAEENVRRLLRAASSAPRMDAAARVRVLDALLANQRERKSAGSSDDRPARREAPRPAAPVVARRRLGAAAGVGLGALAIAAGVALWVTRRPSPTEPPIITATFDNAGPGPREIVLRDGSRTTLDVGARLVERGPGQVELVAGQAVFESARGASALDVRTTAGSVSAASTRFWVRTSDAGAEVAVARGEATLASAKGERGSVGAGEEAVMQSSGGVLPVTAKRVSHLFGFARSTNADQLADVRARGDEVAPRARGTLTGRDPTWRHEAPLDIRGFSIDVVVEDGFARTTVDQTYFNPRIRQIEGTYAFPLPHGAALSRLAMYVDGTRMEGAVVERSRGRDIYEGIVERRRDPALLEWMGDDAFQMRVFPLPGRTEKRIFMSYTTTLEHLYDEERLVVPIPEVDQSAREASFRVRVVGGADRAIRSSSHAMSAEVDGRDQVLTFRASDHALGQDLVITMRGGSVAKETVRSFEEGASRFVRVATNPALERVSAGAPSARSVAVLFDVSASRTEDELAAQARFVDGLLDSFDGDDRVQILTVGHEAHGLPGGPTAASAIDRASVAAFLRSESLGVGDSRLDLGIAAANDALRGAIGEKEIVYVGDGAFVSVGKDSGAKAPRALESIVAPGTRFIGVAIGDGVDRTRLDALANATGGFTVSVGEGEDLGARAFDLVATSYTRCLSNLEAQVVDGAGKPVLGALAELGSRIVCDGERADVIARLPMSATAASVRLRGELDGAPWEDVIDLSHATGGAAYLPRIFAERRVRALVAGMEADVASVEPAEMSPADQETVKEVVALAKQSFLVTPFTSLLVLENDAMYRENGLEKKAPTGWAVYPSPETIGVVHEPLGTDAIALDASGDTLERPSTELFDEPVTGGLGRMGARDVPRFAVRMGGPSQSPWSLGLSGTGEGFGGRGVARPRGDVARRKSTGRLAGAHRTPSSRGWRFASDPGLGAIGTIGASLGGERLALAEASDAMKQSVKHADRAFSPVVDAGASWLELAFRNRNMLAFTYSGDPRLADLTEFVPSMFSDELDPLADMLTADGSAPAPRRDPAALSLIDAALASNPAVSRYTDVRGDVFELTRSTGALSRTRQLPTGLVERTVFDAGRVTSSYPELGLRTVRTTGLATLFWVLRDAPMVPLSRAAFDGLELELLDAHTIRARAPSSIAQGATVEGAMPTVELAFAASGDLSRVTWTSGGHRSSIELQRSGDTVTVRTADGGTTAYTVSEGGAPEPVDAVTYADVELPLRSPTAEPSVGARTPQQIVHDERQLVAAFVALQDDQHALEHLAAIVGAQGSLLPGDVALASRALRGGSKSTRALLAAIDAKDPLRRFVEAEDGKQLSKVAATTGDSLVAMLATYRTLLDALARTPRASFASSLDAFGKRFPEATFFRYALARRTADTLTWTNRDLAIAAWRTIEADAELAPVADRAIAGLLHDAYDLARAEEAHTRLVRAIDAGIARGYAIDLDWRAQRILSSARGEVGAELQVAKWRRAILAGGNAAQLESLIAIVLDPYARGAMKGDLEVGLLVTKLGAAVDPGNDVRTRVAAALVDRGFRSEAQLLLEPMLQGPTPSTAALEIQAVLESDTGDLTRAAGLYDRLLETTASDDLELDVVRGWYASLVNLHFRRAGLASGSNVEWALRDAFAAASRWRREDPGNPAIDELCATALDKLGRANEADAYVASIADRAPHLGSAWGQVGQVFQRRGALDEALAAWTRASAVEPTNPAWLLKRAETLVARGAAGDLDDARDLVRRIRKEKWQDRFSDVVYRAQNLEESALGPVK